MFFDNFGQDEKRANDLYGAFVSSKQGGFRENLVKGKRIKRALKAILGSDVEAEDAFDLLCAQEGA